MTVEDFIKAARRTLDGNISSRRALFLAIVLVGFVLYVGPSFLRWLTRSSRPPLPVPEHPAVVPSSCIAERLYQFEAAVGALDAVVSHVPPLPSDHQHLPYVANGHLALAVTEDAPLYVRAGVQRTLNASVPFLPVVAVTVDGAVGGVAQSEARVIEYTAGSVQILHCYQIGDRSLDATHKYFAHRTLPSVLVQEIKVRNPTDMDVMLELSQTGVSQWNGAAVRRDSVVHGADAHPYVVVTGTVAVPEGQHIGVVIVSSTFENSMTVKGSSIATVRCITVVNYTQPQGTAQAASQEISSSGMEQTAIQTYTEAVSEDPRRLQRTHQEVWQQLWLSGFSISHSLAGDVVNGDVINATLYYVMSQARAPLHEKTTDQSRLYEYRTSLQYTEGCFGDKLHTLQATRLWSPLRTLDQVLETANLWLMLLEKKGCYNMLRAGADGVMQAMILSMGALKFSNQHLEFGMEPKDLHRDYLFRRVNFGNSTHVNITVTVDEENKARLYVALDRSDKSYFACDAGCLDAPVKLGPTLTQFPVKLTDPPTPVLYITSDWQHLEELKHTIHVKEVNLAPAHDHHLMALHRHGHALGGLPTFFWISMFLLIGVFHLFLIKLIINEYFSSSDKYRTRKYSDYR